MLGYAGLERMRPGLDGDSRENLDMVMQAGQRARDLVRQILSFSRRSEPVRAPLDAATMVAEVAKLMRSTLPATIAIEVASLPPRQALVLADASQIHQVLMNLCTNAAQAMAAAGGVLELALERVVLEAGDFLRIVVRDSGPGMDAETRERVLEPFFTTKAEGHGTGLGLAVVQGIVEDHGGHIALDSEPGRGSAFEVVLPAWQGEVAEPLATAALPPGQGRILLVDDEVAVVGMSGKLLQRLGYDVVGQTSSLEALEVFRADPRGFDLVITDQDHAGPHGRGPGGRDQGAEIRRPHHHLLRPGPAALARGDAWARHRRQPGQTGPGRRIRPGRARGPGLAAGWRLKAAQGSVAQGPIWSYGRPAFGAWPRGKAPGFGPGIAGSNPAAPATDFPKVSFRFF